MTEFTLVVVALILLAIYAIVRISGPQSDEIESLRLRLDDGKKALETRQRSLHMLSRRLKELEQERTELLQQVDGLDSQLKNASQSFERRGEQLEQQEQAEESLKTQLKALGEELEVQKSQYSQTLEQETKHTEERLKLSQALDAKVRDNQRLKQSLEEKARENQLLNQNLVHSTSQISDEKTARAGLETKLNRLLDPLLSQHKLQKVIQDLTPSKLSCLSNTLQALASEAGFESMLLSDELGFLVAASQHARGTETWAATSSMLLTYCDRLEEGLEPSPRSILLKDSAERVVMQRIFLAGKSRYILTIIGAGHVDHLDMLDPVVARLQSALTAPTPQTSSLREVI